jgi:Bacterial Ig-like domain
MGPKRNLPATGAAVLLACMGLGGCGSGGDLAEPGARGAIEITTATTGPSPDGDGYGVTLDSVAGGNVAATGSTTLLEVAPGQHRIGLAAASVASNCAVAGENPRAATVQAAETTRVAFAIACTALGGAPSITDVRGPEAADNAPGTGADFTIGFADPEGDVARLTVVAVSDPANAVEPDSVDVDTRSQLQGQASGEIAYRITCGATSPNLCGAGPVTLRFQLTDAAGNRSEARTFELRFGIGNSPTITSVEAPARSSTSRGTRTRIRIAFSDADGDVRKVRLEEVSDTSDAVGAEGELDVSAEAGTRTTGSVTLDFVCRSAVGRACAAGTAVLRFVLVDAESNTSRPRDATIVFEPLTGGGTAPTFTTFEIPPTIGTAAGTRADFVVGFSDPDGDVTTLRIEEVADPNAAFPGNVDLDVLFLADGRDTGTVRETLTCNLPAGSQCPAGRVTLRFTLVDAAGNASAAREATVDFVAPPASSRGAPRAIRGGFDVVRPDGRGAGGMPENEKAPGARLRRLSLK